MLFNSLDILHCLCLHLSICWRQKGENIWMFVVIFYCYYFCIIFLFYDLLFVEIVFLYSWVGYPTILVYFLLFWSFLYVFAGSPCQNLQHNTREFSSSTRGRLLTKKLWWIQSVLKTWSWVCVWLGRFWCMTLHYIIIQITWKEIYLKSFVF